MVYDWLKNDGNAPENKSTCVTEFTGTQFLNMRIGSLGKCSLLGDKRVYNKPFTTPNCAVSLKLLQDKLIFFPIGDLTIL